LLACLHIETAWVTEPHILDESGERVVASDLRYVSPTVQPDPHEMVVNHCTRLLAAAPAADVAVSNALGWDGRPLAFQGHSLATKRIRRANLPTPVRIAWNRAVQRAIQRRNGASTETGRAKALAGAIEELSKMLADSVEVYCRGSTPSSQSESRSVRC
jgi:hypothetical protein